MLRLIPSLTGNLPPLADSSATALRHASMLASMKAEQVLRMGEGEMAKANQVQAGMLGVALLAGGEFSYAHLRYLGLWPFELIARSVWRLAGLLAPAALPGSAVWAALLATVFIALLLWAIAARRGQRRAGAPAPERRPHE